MQDLRVLVIDTPDAVAAVFAHDRVIARFHERLNSVADISEVSSGSHDFDSAPHGLETSLRQTLRMGRRLSNEIHTARITVKPFADDRDVDVHDVSGFQSLVVRDAVADDVVHGRADSLRKSAIVEIRGNRLLHVHDVVVTDPVELFGRHPGNHMLADHVQHVRGQPARGAHFFLFIRCLDRDVHGGPRGRCRPWVPSPRERVRHCSDGHCLHGTRHGIKRRLFWQRK